MALIDVIRNLKSTQIYFSAIGILNNNGRHILTDGRSAPVLTDEKLEEGHGVVVIEDNKGRPFIIAGRK